MASTSVTASPFFHVESPYVIRNLRDRLRNAKEASEGYLAAGYAASMEDYRYRVGMIDGLKNCMEMLDELEKQERN